MRRSIWLSTTAVASLFAAIAAPAFADDQPAVSQTNFTFDAGGGQISRQGLGYAQGSVSVPLGHSFGLQLDGSGGSWNGKAFEGVVGNLFWRDPSFGLFGLYGEYLNSNTPHLVTYDPFTNVTTSSGNSTLQRGGVSADFYADRISVESRLGWEGGTVGNRFFDRANLAYYPTDNFRVALGQIEEAGEGVGTLTFEYQPSEKLGAVFFAEGLETHNVVSAFGGVRFYFGAPSKSLIAHEREDDPTVNTPEDLLAIAHGVEHKKVGSACHNNEGMVIPCV